MAAITVKAEEEGPAIIALGPLFKLTEVFLWDDGSTKDRSFSKKSTVKGDDSSKSVDSECEILQEEIELTKQMNDLGLPLSFGMNKEKRNRQTEGKRKDMPLKHSDTTQVVVGEELESCKVSVGETKSPIIFDDNAGSYLCCIPIMGQLSSSDVVANGMKFQCPSVGGDTSASSTEITSDAVEEQGRDGILGIACNEGQDCDSLHSNVVASGSMKIVATSTDLDNRLCPGSSTADASFSHDKTEPGERLMEDDHLECSSMAFQEAEPSICKDYVPEQPCVSESFSYSMCPEVLDQDGANGHGYGDLGDWMVYSDSFYERNYFYNIRTHTSTWYPPQGMEQLANVETTYKSNEAIAEAIEVDATSDLKTLDLCPNKTESFEESINDDVGNPYCELSVGLELTMSDATLPTAPANICPGLSHEHNESNNTYNDESPSFLSSNVRDHNASLSNTTHSEEVYVDNMSTGTAAAAVNELEMQCDPSVVKRKKRVRRRTVRRKLSNEGEGLFQELSADVGKYWNQRYLLFSRYDDGITMDEEGWFSVTPETLARHHAERCGSGIIIDCFTGVGGNSIQFAHKSKHVTAIDIDPKKIEFAKHNAAIYGVEDRIDFINGDFFLLAPNLKADAIFLSPPWGGPDYAKAKIYDLKTMLKPYDGYFLFNTAKEVASTIVMFLPRNVDLNQLAELALSGTQPWSLEVEKNYLNGKLKGITAYFSDSTGI